MNRQEENSLNFNTLMIKINKNSVNINLYTPSLIFKKRFDDNDKIDIIYRFDKNELRTSVLNKYGENEFYSLTNFQDSSQKSIILLKEMLYYNTFALRAIENIDNAKHTYTYIYDLIKLREVLLNADFSDTVLENYQKELATVILQKQENETNITESIKTNIYMIDDINYEKPII